MQQPPEVGTVSMQGRGEGEVSEALAAGTKFTGVPGTSTIKTVFQCTCEKVNAKKIKRDEQIVKIVNRTASCPELL